MSRYADRTTVTVASSRSDLYKLLQRYGAVETLLHEKPDGIRVGFVYRGLRIAIPFTLPLPKDFDSNAKWEAELRRRWRVVLLVIKSKFEMVEEGAEDVTHAFMPYLMLPSGAIVSEEVIPTIMETYRTGKMPMTLLPGPSVLAVTGGE